MIIIGKMLFSMLTDSFCLVACLLWERGGRFGGRLIGGARARARVYMEKVFLDEIE